MRTPKKDTKTHRLCIWLHTNGPKTNKEICTHFHQIGGKTQSTASWLVSAGYAERIEETNLFQISGHLTNYFDGCTIIAIKDDEPREIVKPAYRPAFTPWTGKHNFTNDRIDTSRSYMTSGVQFCERP